MSKPKKLRLRRQRAHAAQRQFFPRVGIIADGGDQSYGQAETPGFTSYGAAAPGTAAYAAVQALGAFDIVFALGGSYEGWQTGARNKRDLVNAIKGRGTYPNVKNASRGTYVFPYFIVECSQDAASGLPYQGFTSLVIAHNWWLYSGTRGSGEKIATTTSGYYEVNYSIAWGQAIAAAAADSTIVGQNYGTLSNGQGAAQTAANYAASALLTDHPQDSRFMTLTNGAAPNADGIFLDNCFCFPNGGAQMATAMASWDGVNMQNGKTVSAYPAGAGSLISRGQRHFFNTVQNYLAICEPGSNYYSIGNFGNYANTIGYGDIHARTAGAMDNYFNGGLVEGVAGVSGSGWQTYMTAADIQKNYAYIMAYCAPPSWWVPKKMGPFQPLVGLGCYLPATNGSGTIVLRTGGKLVTVEAGSALEYQMMRCMLCLVLMGTPSGTGYLAVGAPGYNYALARWYDEFGDDSLAQVNVKRGYMGNPTSAAVTLSNGVQIRAFDNACALFNAWGNGLQLINVEMITAAIGKSCKYLNGTQQPEINSGEPFLGRALMDGDGLVLLYD